jgi:hypothetical protein
MCSGKKISARLDIMRRNVDEVLLAETGRRQGARSLGSVTVMPTVSQANVGLERST